MKKKSFFILAFFSIFFFSSCKKNRTCTCTTVLASTGGTVTSVITYNKVHKKTAQEGCELRSIQYNSGDKTTCVLTKSLF